MAPSHTKAPNFLYELLQSHLFSDCKLIAKDGQMLTLHKCVVCTQSPVLNAALNGSFTESNNGVLHSAYKVEHLRAMINFLYIGEYDIHACITGDITARATSESEISPDEEAIFHIQVNTVADYYQIPNLAEYTREKTRSNLLPISENEAWVRIMSAADESGDVQMHKCIADWVARYKRSVFHSRAFEDAVLSEGFQLRLLRAVSARVAECVHCYCVRCGIEDP